MRLKQGFRAWAYIGLFAPSAAATIALPALSQPFAPLASSCARAHTRCGLHGLLAHPMPATLLFCEHARSHTLALPLQEAATIAARLEGRLGARPELHRCVHSAWALV